MKVKLVGVHKVRARLKDGSETVYYYAWRGGPRITSRPGTVAFTQEFARLIKGRPQASGENTLGWLVGEYLKSAAYQKLKPSTRRDYERIAGVIRVRFATFPLAAMEARGARKVFLEWRDEMRATPRSADLNLAVLARIISWARNNEIVMRNPLERPGRLHDGGARKDAIWMPTQLDRFLTQGAPHLVDVFKMALWTMQRQGDVLTMPTMAYDDGRLWIRQGKTGARIRIRPAGELEPILDGARKAERQRILVNSFGQNWTSSGFRASWRKELARLDIKGVTFHDLRGTGISYAYANGMDVERIAEISGHSKAECEGIIRRHYLAGSDIIDAIRAGTKSE